MIEQFIREVLAEDVGRGDLYARVSDALPASAKIIAKSDGVLAGEAYLRVLSDIEKFTITWHKQDGVRFVKGEVLMELSGDSHTLLRIERTLLNMLLHASSIATLTRKYVD